MSLMQLLRDQSGPPPFSGSLVFVALLFYVVTSGTLNAMPPKADDSSCLCVPPSICKDYSKETMSLTKSKYGQPSDLVYCCDRVSPTPEAAAVKPERAAKPPKKVKRSASKTGCGNRKRRSPSPDETLQQITAPGEYPWQVVFLDSPDDGTLTVKCGASVIHPRVVLTTVDCVQKWENRLDQLVIRVGEYDGQDDDEKYPHQDGKVAKIIKHEGFYKKGNVIQNDVALIIMETPFKLGENIGTLCLPPQDFKFEKEKCYIAGWESNAFDKSGLVEKIEGRLVESTMTVMSHNPCMNLLKRTQLGQSYKMHSSFICVKGEVGKNEFRHHNGCPLVCPIEKDSDQYYQAGMIVQTPHDYEETTPFIYVNVAKFINWIDQKMVEHDFETSYYKPYDSETPSSSSLDRITFFQN